LNRADQKTHCSNRTDRTGRRTATDTSTETDRQTDAQKESVP